MPSALRPFLIRNRVTDMPNRDTYRAAVAGEVRAAIARAGMRPADVAAATGISRTALSQKLRGRAPIHAEEIFEIADVLGISAGALVEAAAVERVA